jgi:SAM-dependent methyltransferase
MASWQERHDDARQHMLPFLERVVGLTGRRVLEFGAGAAPITCALAPHVDRVLGLDIAEGDIALGREKVRERGLTGVELQAGPFERLLDLAREREGEVDLFLLFAVLEHMTLDERHRVLVLARDVLAPGGSIAVFETPNRLLWWDHHTSLLPFFGMLDPDLAIAYADRSPREGFAAGLRDAGDDARLRLTRHGRGASQHELELALGPLERRIVAGGYEPELFPTRHVHREELYLARFGAKLDPPLSPVFSRYWLDLVLRFDDAPPAPLVEPWPFSTHGAHAVTLTAWETLHFAQDGAWLEVPAARAAELHLGIEHHPRGAELRIEHGAGPPRHVAVPPSERTQYRMVALDGADAPARITAVAAGTELSFVGVRAAPLP